jgi:hypothetical protein
MPCFFKIHLSVIHPSTSLPVVSSFQISGQFVQNFFLLHVDYSTSIFPALTFATVIIFGESISCKVDYVIFFSPPVTSFLLLQIFCSVLYSQSWSVCVLALGKGAARTFMRVGSQKT